MMVTQAAGFLPFPPCSDLNKLFFLFCCEGRNHAPHANPFPVTVMDLQLHDIIGRFQNSEVIHSLNLTWSNQENSMVPRKATE